MTSQLRRFLRTGLSGALAVTLLLTLGCKPKPDEEILRDVDRQLQQRNVLSASLQLKDFIKKRPDSPNIQIARMKLAQCYFFDRDFARSREILDDVIKASGGRGNQAGLNAVSLKLDTYAAEMKFKEALDEALLTSPSLGSMEAKYRNFFHMRIGELFINNERTTEALQVYQDLLDRPDLEGDYALQAVRVQGQIHLKNKDKEAALKGYADYLAKHPGVDFNYVLHRDMGQLLESLNRMDEAKASFGEAEAILLKRFDEALGAEKKSAILFELADTYFAQGRKDDGKNAIRRVVDEFPTGRLRGQAMLMLAESHNQDGDPETAIDMLGKVAQAYPGSQEAMIAMRRSQEIRKARSEAAATSDTAKTADGATSPTVSGDAATTAPAQSSEPAGQPGQPGAAGSEGGEGGAGAPGTAGASGAAGQAGAAGASGQSGQTGKAGQAGTAGTALKSSQTVGVDPPKSKKKSKD